MPHDVVPIARALVLALFPAIAAAMRAGRAPRVASDDAWDAHGPRWRAEYGPDVAREAAAILDALGAVDVLIKSGTAALDCGGADRAPAGPSRRGNRDVASTKRNPQAVGPIPSRTGWGNRIMRGGSRDGRTACAVRFHIGSRIG